MIKTDEFQYEIVDIARTAKVTEGGKRLRMRVAVVIGDLKGKVGFGIGKGQDKSDALQKAINQAKKNLIEVPIINGTLPFEVKAKFKSSKVLLKPSKPGNGLIAGSTVRRVLFLAGYKDATAKIVGVTKNSLTNALAAIYALQKLARLYQSKLKLKEIWQKKKNDSNPRN